MIFLIQFVSCTSIKDQSKKKVPFVEVHHPRLRTLMNVNSQIEVLAQGFDWSEGPVWVDELDALLFSDVPQNIVYIWKEETGLDTFLYPSGFTHIAPSNGEGSNGLLLSESGELILCQHGDRRIAKLSGTLSKPIAQYETIINAYEGKRFNSPNDGCFDRQGRLYFTDPPYGLNNLDTSKDKELEFNGVYRIDPNGSLTLLDSTLTKPNGIALSPDQSRLMVSNSDPDRAIWMQYNVFENGDLSEGRLFSNMTNAISSSNLGLPDGLKYRSDGILFATGPGGVLIYDADATHLGTIRTGHATANCAFDASESYLYMTADGYLMRIKM